MRRNSRSMSRVSSVNCPAANAMETPSTATTVTTAEYGMMQLIAETYDLMKRGLCLNDDQLRDAYSKWNNGELNSYLMEISSHIFGKVDETTSRRLIDEILAVAKQKGTGMWTSQSAMELQVPIPTIDLAVAMQIGRAH